MWFLVFCAVIWLLVAVRALFWKPNPEAGEKRVLMLKLAREESMSDEEKTKGYLGCLKSWVIDLPWLLLSAVCPAVTVWGALHYHIGDPVYAYLAIAAWVIAGFVTLPFGMRTAQRLKEADEREEAFVAERMPLWQDILCHIPDIYAFYVLVTLLSLLSQRPPL